MPHPAVLFSCFCFFMYSAPEEYAYRTQYPGKRYLRWTAAAIRSAHRHISPVLCFPQKCRSHDTAPAGRSTSFVSVEVYICFTSSARTFKSAGSPLQSHSWRSSSTVGRTSHAETRSVIAVAVAVRLKHNRLSFYCFIRPKQDGTCVLGKDISRYAVASSPRYSDRSKTFPNQEYTLVPK